MPAPATRPNGHEHEPGIAFVHIDGASMYQQMTNTSLTMVRVETTVNNVQAQVTNISTRLDKLEPKVWAIPSAATIIAGAALAVALWDKFGG